MSGYEVYKLKAASNYLKLRFEIALKPGRSPFFVVPVFSQNFRPLV